MNQKNIIQSIEGALVADAYALGAHWIYDEKQLQSLPIDWSDLNAPQAMWHKGKSKGDFTHYGDHGVWLYQYIEQSHHFDIAEYRDYWLEKMENYTGYVDGSSRETKSALQLNPSLLEGSASHDLSIIGRIAPLLLVSSSKADFLSSVDAFVSFTHNSSIVRDAAQFFGSLLYDVCDGNEMITSLKSANPPSQLQKKYEAAVQSSGSDTFTSIRSFGPACGVEGGFEGVIHLLMTYTDYQEAMIANAKAGGDNAARGMIVGMILGASRCTIPLSWKQGTTNLPGL